ncbi:MAG TPA: hypothetical protein PLL18_10125, partial [Flavobacteriales bacterium]|nr:hypothetical protein [Flavobacteriales bacterium]
MESQVQVAPAAELLSGMRAAMDAGAYRVLFDRLVAEHRTTGPDQSDEMLAYTKLNLARTVRNEK